MRRLDRGQVAAPASLSGPSAAVGNEISAGVAYYATWEVGNTAFAFSQYRGDDVKAALRKLSGGNCAYCESKVGAVGADEVEHYRPKGGVEEDPSHPGYWWLAHDWQNLLPTCRDCNKSLRQHIVTPGMTREEVEALLAHYPSLSHGKANQFAVLGLRATSAASNLADEDPLLIDPCRQDPQEHLTWDFSAELTLIEARPAGASLSPYGRYTIKACALNRAQLVLDRIGPMRQMRLLRTVILEQLERWSGNVPELQAILQTVEVLKGFSNADQPYAGMAAAFVHQFLEELDRWRSARGLQSFE
jgi:uncharacterized protein (TIGR02646 family)